MMRKIAFTISTAALALSAVAVAQTAPAPERAAARVPQGDVNRADAQTRADRMFARMDANGDGKVDQADRAAMRVKMFDKLDANRDGAISQSEFAAWSPPRAGERRMAVRSSRAQETATQTAERRSAMFTRLDTDKNGTISRAEFEARTAARAEKRDKRRGDRMAAAGPLTRQTFVDRALTRFDRADANRDGTVTAAERQAAREARRQSPSAAPVQN